MPRRTYKKKTKGWSTGKVLVIAAGTGAVLGGGYYGYQFIRNKQVVSLTDNDTQTPPPSPSAGSQLPEPPTHLAFPLKPGDRNVYVQKMQKALLKLGGKVASLISESGGADGVFGNGTREALFEGGFENRMYNYVAGTEVSWQEYNNIVAKADTLGSLDPRQLAKVAVSTKQTYLIDPDLFKDDPRPYPAEANLILGYLITERDGLAQILHENGKKYYTSSSSIKVL